MISKEDSGDVFSSNQIKHFEQEVKDRWGDAALRESQDRIAQWSPEERKQLEAEGNDILERIVELMDKGPEDPAVREQIARYYGYINNFFDYTPEIFRALGIMYAKDERFAAYLKKYHEDLPEFMRAAITIYVDDPA